jgi:hypothetical protein
MNVLQRLLVVAASAGAGVACKFPELPPVDIDAMDGAGQDADVDTAPAVIGGDTLAQTSFPTVWLHGTAVAAPDGGVVISFRNEGQNPVQISGTTIPCTRCEIIAKLAPDLTQVDWFAYATDVLVQEGWVTTSPNGSVYWTTETRGEGTYDVTLNGSDLVSPITVHSPGSSQGEELGGVRIVVAFSPTGALRWTNVLTQSNTATGNYLDSFMGFGASDGAVVATYRTAKGTLSYTNVAGSPATLSIPAASYVLHEIDAATGRTVQIITRAQTFAGDRHADITGVGGFSGKGFAALRELYDQNNNGTGVAVMIGGLMQGVLTPTVNTPTSTRLTPARYKNLLGATASIANSVTIGSSTFQAASTNGDAGYFILDGTSSAVRASSIVGGSSYDVPKALVDVGNDDVYCAGTYLSSDLAIGGTDLPDPVDASASAIFVTRSHVDLENRTLPTVWARGFAGTKALTIISATADAITGDAYLFGVLSPSGTANLGGQPIDSPPNASAVFVVKIRRGD